MRFWIWFLAVLAIWTVAGYRIGYVKGAGWRDAVIGHDCHMTCRLP